MGEILLDAAPDDLVDPDAVRRLMRDLREVRMAKMRAGVSELEGGGGVSLTGVGGMEVGEGRAFISGVVDGLRYALMFEKGKDELIDDRKIGASKEQARREREAEDRENGYDGTADEDDEMGL